MSKAYILIEIPKERRSRDISNLRKYLKNHDFSKFETNEPVEIISQLLDPAPDYYDKLVNQKHDVAVRKDEDEHVVIRENSNQELLENWARETFEENSDEMKLLLSDETNNNDRHLQIEEFENRNLKRPSSFKVEDLLDLHDDEDGKQSSVQTISSDTNSRERYYSSSSSDTVVENIERYYNKYGGISDCEKEMHEHKKVNSKCHLCDKVIEAGSKKSQLREQLSHITKDHPMCNVLLEHIIKRYQCQACDKYLSAFVPPCEHINNSHRRATFEIRFNDMWTTKQINQCNVTLRMCFGRHLPIPRGRRATNMFDNKLNYTIFSHEELESGEASCSRTLRTQCVGLSAQTMARKYGVSERPSSFTQFMNWLDSDEDHDDHEEKEEEVQEDEHQF